MFTSFGEGTVITGAGELLAADATGPRILKFSPPFSDSNTGVLFASGTPPNAFDGVAINSAGEVFVSEGGVNTVDGTGNILRFSPEGEFLGVFASGLRNPAFLQFDSAGNLYVTEFVAQITPTEIDSVIRISPDGTKTVIAALRGALGLVICGIAP